MWKSSRRALILVVGVSAGACTTVRKGRPTSPGPDQRAAPVVSPSDSAWANVGRPCGAAEPTWEPRLDSAARRLTHGRDAETASLAREVPGGYGGLYLDGGRVVVLLTDTLRKDAARRELARRIPRPDLDIERARVIPARWTFAQLHDWWAYISARRVRFEGATMFDIDERANRLVYGFRDSTALRRAEEDVRPLELPCYLVAFVIRPPVRLR